MMLPRLLDASLHEIARLHPSSLSIEENMAPLSTATMVLPGDEPAVDVGAFVELFTPRGSAGIFRVVHTERPYPGTAHLSLEHGLVTLADCIIPGTLQEQLTPAREAFTYVLSHQSQWTLGTFDVPEDVTLTWSHDYANVLKALLSLMDKLPAYRLTFDQSALPWKLNVVALADTDASEARLTRNLRSLSVEQDWNSLCTRLYIPGASEPLDADTIDQYGVISRSLTGDEGLTLEELTTYGRQYLEEHKHPGITVTMDALDLSHATGEAIDAFYVGRMCRTCLPDYGLTLRQRVVALQWLDLASDDMQVHITLASKAENTADALASLVVDTTVMRKKYWAEIGRQKELLISAEEKITLASRAVEVLGSDVVTLRAGVESNAAAITLANGRIDAQANEIALKANKIDLQGYVTMEQFHALEGDIDNLFASDLIVHGGLSTDSITAGEADFDNLLVGQINGQNPDDWIAGHISQQGIATRSWVTGTALTPYITAAKVTADFLKKSAVTTKEITYVYTVGLNKEYTSIPGTDGVYYVALSSATVTYNTSTAHVLVYA